MHASTNLIMDCRIPSKMTREVVGDLLTGIHNVMAKSLLVVNKT
jgi:hypothetical protein